MRIERRDEQAEQRRQQIDKGDGRGDDGNDDGQARSQASCNCKARTHGVLKLRQLAFSPHGGISADLCGSFKARGQPVTK